MIGPRRLRAFAAVVVAIVAAMVTVAGCGNDPAHPATSARGEFRVVTVTVHGRATTCVTWQHGYAGGITCDFAHAKRQMEGRTAG